MRKKRVRVGEVTRQRSGRSLDEKNGYVDVYFMVSTGQPLEPDTPASVSGVDDYFKLKYSFFMSNKASK